MENKKKLRSSLTLTFCCKIEKKARERNNNKSKNVYVCSQYIKMLSNSNAMHLTWHNIPNMNPQINGVFCFRFK